jgi:NIMA (never in mitosis gene a)-related kinase
MNEIKVLSSFTHTNIIGYIDHFLNNDVMNIVMEFAPGDTLHKQIQTQGRLRCDALSSAAGATARGAGGAEHLFSEGRVWVWFVQIRLALQHVHSKHILHRDMKPMNIMLSGPGQRVVKLGDFGIAKSLQSDADMASTLKGTPFYLSPGK